MFSVGLELILNVNQLDGVPFVTSSAGVILAVSDNEHRRVNPKTDGIKIPTGFETNVILNMVCKSFRR